MLLSVKRTLNADFCTKCPYSGWAFRRKAGHPPAMLTDFYINALLGERNWRIRFGMLGMLGRLMIGLRAFYG